MNKFEKYIIENLEIFEKRFNSGFIYRYCNDTSTHFIEVQNEDILYIKEFDDLRKLLIKNFISFDYETDIVFHRSSFVEDLEDFGTIEELYSTESKYYNELYNQVKERIITNKVIMNNEKVYNEINSKIKSVISSYDIPENYESIPKYDLINELSDEDLTLIYSF